MRRLSLSLTMLLAIGCTRNEAQSPPDLAAFPGDLADPDLAAPDLANPDLAIAPDVDLASATDVDLLPLPIPTTTLTFTEQAGDVLNPERGWFGYTSIGGSFSKVRSPTDPAQTPPTTIATVKMDLDQTMATIPSATLTALTNTCASARSAGVKIVLRPVYRMDDSAGAGVDPSTAAFIVSHVAQLGQTLRDNADVILAVELGLLGPWGEFHSTPLVDDDDTWVDILDALLDELPTSRTVLVRRPCFKDHFFGATGPLLDAEQWSGTPRARVGHFNDCFLGDTTADQGTYQEPAAYITQNYSVDQWRAYTATDSRFAFVGGETCGNNARASCPSALLDLALFHWSFLGHGWYQPTVGPTGVLADCRDEITDRLGYRLVLEQATISQSVRPGDALQLSVTLRNEGFAPPVNPRPIDVVLQSGSTTYTALLTGDDVDPRRWAPGTTTTFARTIGVPSSALPDDYTLALWLPDAAPSIRARPEYAIRFVNQGTWGATTGYNLLTSTLSIAASAAPNGTTPDATFAP